MQSKILQTVGAAYMTIAAASSAMNQQTWRSVDLAVGKLVESNIMISRPISDIMLAGTGTISTSRKLVCRHPTDGSTVVSSMVLPAHYFEGDDTQPWYKCWTTEPYAPVEIQVDGLYYYIDYSIQLPFQKCLQACRRRPGFRLAIVRNSDMMDAVVYYRTIKPDSEPTFFTDLEVSADGTSFFHSDGTAYTLTVPTVGLNGGRNFFMNLNWEFIDALMDAIKPCLCQGNLDDVTW